MAHVYKITNPNGKIYIGSTINIERRFSDYKKLKCKKQHLIYNSLVKYGVENHNFEIICECDKSIMRHYEALYGNKYNTLKPNGLNLALPKLGEMYESLSEETKKKMSESNKGRVKTEQERKNLSIALTGNKLSNKTKEKIRIAHLGKTASEETKAKISIANSGENNPMFGKSITEEHRGNLRTSHLGKKSRLGIPMDEKTKAILIRANTGKVASEETRKKRSKSMKGKNTWAKGTIFSEERKKSISERVTLYWANKRLNKAS